MVFIISLGVGFGFPPFLTPLGSSPSLVGHTPLGFHTTSYKLFFNAAGVQDKDNYGTKESR